MLELDSSLVRNKWNCVKYLKLGFFQAVRMIQTTLQQAVTKQVLLVVWLSLALETWWTSICCTRRKRGRISILVLINFNRTTQRLNSDISTMNLDTYILMKIRRGLLQLQNKYYDRIFNFKFKRFIQRFQRQEINSEIYVVTEEGNIIVNQVLKHRFAMKIGNYPRHTLISRRWNHSLQRHINIVIVFFSPCFSIMRLVFCFQLLYFCRMNFISQNIHCLLDTWRYKQKQ